LNIKKKRAGVKGGKILTGNKGKKGGNYVGSTIHLTREQYRNGSKGSKKKRGGGGGGRMRKLPEGRRIKSILFDKHTQFKHKVSSPTAWGFKLAHKGSRKERGRKGLWIRGEGILRKKKERESKEPQEAFGGESVLHDSEGKKTSRKGTSQKKNEKETGVRNRTRLGEKRKQKKKGKAPQRNNK